MRVHEPGRKPGCYRQPTLKGTGICRGYPRQPIQERKVTDSVFDWPEFRSILGFIRERSHEGKGACKLSRAIGVQNDIDPLGINGRNARTAAATSYLYNIKSDGFGVTLSMRPTRTWEVRFNYTAANGYERSSVEPM